MKQYRISVYQNGFGHHIYRPEWSFKFWPFWHCVELMDSPYSTYILEFEDLDEAIQYVNKSISRAEEIKQLRKRVKCCSMKQ